MNRQDEIPFEPRIADWLEDGPHDAPDRALDVVLAAFPSIKQRRAMRPPWRAFEMSLPLKLASMAAAVVVVVGGAIVLGPWFGRSADVGQPDASATPTPAASRATPRPSPTTVFEDNNEYIVEMNPGFSSGNPVPGWLAIIGPNDPFGRRLEIDIAAEHDEPDWSPDGTRIAFVARTQTSQEVWTASATGADAALVATCAAPCSAVELPAWSPDGTRIAYVEVDLAEGRSQPLGGRVVVVDVASGQRSVVAEGGPENLPGDPRWEPDGDRLVISRAEVGVGGALVRSGLSLINADGTGESGVDVLGATPGQPDWGPDGLLVFTDATNIFTVPVDGGSPTRVTNLSAASQRHNYNPRWTPDGRIVYIHEPTNGPGSVISVAPDGSDEAIVFGGSGGRTFPSRPDPRP